VCLSFRFFFFPFFSSLLFFSFFFSFFFPSSHCDSRLIIALSVSACLLCLSIYPSVFLCFHLLLFLSVFFSGIHSATLLFLALFYSFVSFCISAFFRPFYSCLVSLIVSSSCSFFYQVVSHHRYYACTLPRTHDIEQEGRNSTRNSLIVRSWRVGVRLRVNVLARFDESC